MKYIAIKHPEIYTDACKLYDLISALYPGKRDLTATPEFKRCVENENIKNSMLQPILEIPLMPKQISATTTTTTTTTTTSKEMTQTEEIPLAIHVADEEIEKMIADLREDPDLMSILNDFHLQEITVETTVETTAETSSFASEIDQMIQEEFNALGRDLPDIMDNEDELFW